MKRRWTRRAALLLVMMMAAACAGEDGPGEGSSDGSIEELRSDKQRIMSPEVPSEDVQQLTSDNRDFAMALYGELAASEEGNLFLSPHSISAALAMTYAGAEGNTEAEIAEAMRFRLPEAELHPAMNALDLELESRADAEPEGGGEPLRLEIANALFGQTGYPFLEGFLDVLAVNYGAGMRLLDFVADAEAARGTINAWVEEKTEDRIKDLLPQGSVNGDTRLVLVNAIYFKASWSEPFEESATSPAAFTRLDGSEVNVPMMNRTESLPYAAGEGYQAVALPYAGDAMSMVFIVPDAGTFSTFEASLTGEGLGAILGNLGSERVELRVPTFTFESDFSLSQTLQALGMSDAFSPGAADLSGMDGSRELFVMDVIHKAFVGIDEEGTEAAAATAVTVGTTSVPPPPTPVQLDRPFLFLIHDHATGAVIFLGRVVDPS